MKLTLSEKGTIRKSKEPTVLMTVSGNAESTEQATVYPVDLGVFVMMLLLEDSPFCLWVYFAKKWATPVIGKGKGPHR